MLSCSLLSFRLGERDGGAVWLAVVDTLLLRFLPAYTGSGTLYPRVPPARVAVPHPHGFGFWCFWFLRHRMTLPAAIAAWRCISVR